MKFLIISDSHGIKEELFQVFQRHEKDVAAMIHCGDSELPLQAFSDFENLIIVGGNCDNDPQYQEEISTVVSGVNIFVVHGHLYNVKSSAVKLSYRAEELGAKLVCFGHSHIPVAFQENGVLYVNPGSFRRPRLRIERSYAIVEYHQDKVTVIFYDHLGNEIQDLKHSFQIV